MEKMNASFPPRMLEVDVVNDLVMCAIHRARPHLNLPDLYLEHCFSINGTHPYGRCHMCFIAWWPLHYVYQHKTIPDSP